MMFDLPSRIRRMSRRRQRIAARRWLEKKLQRFVGEPNSPLVRAEVTKIVRGKAGVGFYIEAVVQPRTTVEKIDISFVVAGHAAEPAAEREE